MTALQLKHLLTRIVHHNDERAFSTLFDCYYTRLMNLAMLFIPQYDQSQEIVSEVFVQLLKKKQDLLKIERFEGYLFTMVKNRALNFLKSRIKTQGHILIDDLEDHLTSDYILPDEKLINDDLRLALVNAIQQLPPKRRLAFKMVKDEGMSYKEVAAILDISERTVEVHLKLAIQNLRIVLEDFYEEHKSDLPLTKQRFLSIFL